MILTFPPHAVLQLEKTQGTLLQSMQIIGAQESEVHVRQAGTKTLDKLFACEAGLGARGNSTINSPAPPQHPSTSRMLLGATGSRPSPPPPPLPPRSGSPRRTRRLSKRTFSSSWHLPHQSFGKPLILPKHQTFKRIQRSELILTGCLFLCHTALN
jgi:hypothetical protein